MIAEKSPEVEEMEVVTAQLSRQLCIEDIDTVDSENPQLCAEYVKDIYEYMMMLEVRKITNILSHLCRSDSVLLFSVRKHTMSLPSTWPLKLPSTPG